jgi:hypothetical protein
VLVVDSITKLPPNADGEIAIAASHGGIYPAYPAAAAGLRGVVLHDAGVGLDQAGIACLAYFDALGHPAATVAHMLGGVAASALRVDAVAAIYNDAGVGIDDAGISRLAALDRRGIPAATVDAFTARIGSARSTCDTGMISHVNHGAAALGGRPGMGCQELIMSIYAGD